LKPPNVRFDLTQLPATNNIIYHSHIKELRSEYPDYTTYLTDGSRSNSKTGYAYSIASTIRAHRMRNKASVFVAELTTIFACLSWLTQSLLDGKFLLLTDSLSSLFAILNTSSTNLVVQRIHLTLHTLTSINTKVTLIWIPGHINLPEHADAVDMAARQATRRSKISDGIPLPASDYRNYYRFLVLQSWTHLWKNQFQNILRSIKQAPSPWKTSNRDSRREVVILARLKIGHTRLTHGHLLNPYLITPPTCLRCRSDNLTVNHFFSCPHPLFLRTIYNDPPNLSSALKNNLDLITRSLQYLRATKFFPHL